MVSPSPASLNSSDELTCLCGTRDLTSPPLLQNSRMNSTEEEPAGSPSCRRQLSLMTPAGTQLSATRRVKSAVDLVSLVMAEQMHTSGAGRGSAGAAVAAGASGAASGLSAGLGTGLGAGLGSGPGAGLGAVSGPTGGCSGASGSGWAAGMKPVLGVTRAGHLWQAAARRGGECQIYVPVTANDSFGSSPGSEHAPTPVRGRAARGHWGHQVSLAECLPEQL